jgi:hypothetical protein
VLCFVWMSTSSYLANFALSQESPFKPKQLTAELNAEWPEIYPATSKRVWAKCQSQILNDEPERGHVTMRKDLIGFAEMISVPPSSASLLDSINEGRSRGEVIADAGEETVFAQWLVYMHTLKTYADYFCVVLLARMIQTQVRVYTFCPKTGSPRNSPVDESLREPSALCLLLDTEHYFLLIAEQEWIKLPPEKRSEPACTFTTPDGEGFLVFGVKNDGNCFFRAIDKWKRLLSIDYEGLRTGTWFNDGKDRPIQAGQAELYLSNDSTILLRDVQRVLTPGDSVYDPDGVPEGQAFIAGHALLGSWKRAAIILTSTFKLVDMDRIHRYTIEAAPASPASDTPMASNIGQTCDGTTALPNWALAAISRTQSKFATMLRARASISLSLSLRGKTPSPQNNAETQPLLDEIVALKRTTLGSARKNASLRDKLLEAENRKVQGDHEMEAAAREHKKVLSEVLARQKSSPGMGSGTRHSERVEKNVTRAKSENREQELERVRDLLLCLQGTYGELKEQSEQAYTDHASQQLSSTNTIKALKSAATKSKSVQTRLDGANERILELEGELTLAEEERDELQLEAGKLTTANKKLVAKPSKQQVKEAKDAKTTADGLQSKLKTANDEIADLENRVTSAEDQIETAQTLTASAKLRLATSEQTRLILQGQLTTSRAALDTQRGDHELTSTNSNAEVTELKQAIATLRTSEAVHITEKAQHITEQAQLQSRVSTIENELEEARTSKKRSAQELDDLQTSSNRSSLDLVKAQKKAKKSSDQTLRKQKEHDGKIDGMKIAAKEAKAESQRVLDQFKQDARDEKQQRNQETMMARMINTCSGNLSQQALNSFQQATSFSNFGPRTRSSSRSYLVGSNDFDDHANGEEKLKKPPLKDWNSTQVKTELKAVELDQLHEYLATRGLGNGLGLCQITSEDQLLHELKSFIEAGQMYNIHVKSLFALIVEWKKVDSLHANVARAHTEH